MHQSIATIDSPEFINLQPLELNPLMSSCEIKVLYIGENRNHSFITKEVATEMSKTLRGAPIVGYYKTDKEDFADHGSQVTIDGDGVKFECMTKPYGFVSPDAKVWFQKFEDYDDFGNPTVREYLMTTGYLWTGQFEECQSVVENGKSQSMELDEASLDGYWSTNSKSNMDFFIINDAIFSKLCILGDDVEPCFEGANVTSPNVSTSFSLDDTFKHTLFSMMQDLKNFALGTGGQEMDNLENTVVENEATENQNFTENAPSTEEPETSFKKDDKDKEKEAEDNKKESADDNKEKTNDSSDEDDKKDNEDNKDKKEDNDEDKKKKPAKHSLEAEEVSELQAKFTALQKDFADLQAHCNELEQFKLKIDNKEKDQLIDSFYMLSDEDKQDVITNKEKYSYDDIEAKLSVICVRKKVNFDLEDTSKNENKVEETPITTFNLNDDAAGSVPAFVSALRNARNHNN